MTTTITLDGQEVQAEIEYQFHHGFRGSHLEPPEPAYCEVVAVYANVRRNVINDLSADEWARLQQVALQAAMQDFEADKVAAAEARMDARNER